MSWTDIKDDVVEQFFHSAKILVTVFFHGFLFVMWVLLDACAGRFVHWLGEEGLHETMAHVFRFIASAGIFSVAVLPAISDILEAIGSIRKKIFESWNLVCKTCPAKQLDQEKTE